MHTCIDCHINLFLEASHISIDDPSLIYIYKTYIYIYIRAQKQMIAFTA